MFDDVNMPVVEEKTEEELLDSPVHKLNPRQQRFVHMHLSGQYKMAEIAELIGVSIYTIRGWLANPKIKQIITEFQTEEDDIVKQGIKALRMKALNKMSDLVDSNMDAIAYQAARDILDRTGHKGTEKKELSVEIYTFEQQLKDIISKKEKISAIDVEILDK